MFKRRFPYINFGRTWGKYVSGNIPGNIPNPLRNPTNFCFSPSRSRQWPRTPRNPEDRAPRHLRHQRRRPLLLCHLHFHLLQEADTPTTHPFRSCGLLLHLHPPTDAPHLRGSGHWTLHNHGADQLVTIGESNLHHVQGPSHF